MILLIILSFSSCSSTTSVCLHCRLEEDLGTALITRYRHLHHLICSLTSNSISLFAVGCIILCWSASQTFHLSCNPGILLRCLCLTCTSTFAFLATYCTLLFIWMLRRDCMSSVSSLKNESLVRNALCPVQWLLVRPRPNLTEHSEL